MVSAPALPGQATKNRRTAHHRRPAGDPLIIMISVVPLVVSCLALAVYELGDLRELGKIGLTTLTSTLVLSAGSVAIGLLLVNLLHPGEHLDPQSRGKLLAEAESGDPGRLQAAA